MRKYLTLLLLAAVAGTACTRTYRSLGDTHLGVFDRAHVQFLPDSLGTFTEADADGIIHLTNGRIILKKIALPDYKRKVDVKLTVRVESDGDRWDKSGSVFVIPESSGINLLSIAKGEASFPTVDSLRFGNLIGTVPGEDYLPTVELLRFMTPFGVGYYSRRDTSAVSLTRPVYIDGWADCSSWEADVTDLYPLLKGQAYIGVFVDTWTAEGYIVSADIEVKEDRNPYSQLPERNIVPLINTLYYMGQSYPDLFSRQDISVDFTLPQSASLATLKYIVTGHGGHDGGDEFTPQRNIISLDKETVLDFTPWRTDCASFRRFNPTSGTWAVKREASFYGEKGREKKVIDEIMAENDKGKKKKKSIFGFLEPNTLIKILCGSIPFIIFFIYNSRRMIQNPEKKELDDGTKELLEAIKERGKKSPNYKEPEEKKEEKVEDKDKKENKDNKEKKE